MWTARKLYKCGCRCAGAERWHRMLNSVGPCALMHTSPYHQKGVASMVRASLLRVIASLCNVCSPWDEAIFHLWSAISACSIAGAWRELQRLGLAFCPAAGLSTDPLTSYSWNSPQEQGSCVTQHNCKEKIPFSLFIPLPAWGSEDFSPFISQTGNIYSFPLWLHFLCSDAAVTKEVPM